MNPQAPMNPNVLKNGEASRHDVPGRPATGNLRLRGGTDSGFASGVRSAEPAAGEIGPQELALAIASYTFEALVEANVLDPVADIEPYQVYCRDLGHEPSAGHGILHFLFPEDDRLEQVARQLNLEAHRHVWEIAHRITPPEGFYKAHPEIVEACKLCGAVILDAATQSTITTGSINPLAGDFLAHWIQAALARDPSETRPRFFFHVVVPPRHWPAIVRSHFRNEHAL
jgi:hypothetical protein